jgi:superfamily II DNA or RNA helicase
MPIGIEKSPAFEQLQKALAYEDKRVTYQYLTWKKTQKNDDRFLQSGGRGYRHWFVQKHGREALDDKVKQLNAERWCSCLQKDGDRYWTYSGLQRLVEQSLGLKTEPRQFITPEDWKLVPWATKPHEPRWYQSKAVDLLCPLDGSRTHGAVSMGTGTGKSLVMAYLVKRTGLDTVVVVPTLGIGRQMLKDFQNWFGVGKVGQFFDGKKKIDRKITIAVSKSLMNVEIGTKEWEHFQSKKMLLCDESHTCPPDSLATVMFNLLASTPYRYFFSGTQFRNDGLGMLLQCITNDIVFDLPVRQGISEGFLSPLKFFQWRITSDDGTRSSDIIKMNKLHLQQNNQVYKHAAALINHAVKDKGRRVLVLVDGVGQFKRLLDGGLSVPAKFAHGGTTKDNRGEVPEEFWKSDPMALVEEFDNGKFPVLVGTSCIGMGVDTKSVDFIVSIVGFTSEIEVSQSAGRGTRLFPGKTECHYHDYWVTNIEEMDRHAKKRMEIFNSIYGECRVMEASSWMT